MASITVGGAPAQTVGELPEVGAPAPDFTLVDPEFSELKLSDFAGRRVILNILPSIATDICQATMRYFNEAAASVEGTSILGVSMDLPMAHKGFLAAEGIENVVMASAFRSDFGDRYGATMATGTWNGLFARAIVVLDTDHRVIYTELVSEVAGEPDYDAALAALG